MRPHHIILTHVFVLVIALATASHAAAPPQTITHAVMVSIAPPWDTIDPGVAECVVSAVDYVEERGYALIVELDTYGGWLDSAFQIGDRFLNARAPVIVFVSGGKALSAGTMISLSAHVLAVSPTSIIGAMQPVLYDPTTGAYQPTNESKIIMPVLQKATLYAEERSRNVTAVREFITRNLVLTGSQAVRYGVADLEAADLSDLLTKLDGIEVNTSAGTYVLQIEGVERYSCGVRSRFISLLANPIINSVLMTIGVLGTLFAVITGRFHALPITVALLLLGLVGAGFSPSLISAALILVGALLLAIELFVTPGFGVLGFTGIFMIAAGIALIPTAAPSTMAPPPGYVEGVRAAALGIALALGAFFSFMIYKVVEAKRRPPIPYGIVGKRGVAASDIPPGGRGFVKVEGEYWVATGEEAIREGDEVVVIARKDHIIVVRKADNVGSG